ncbi:aspartokinase-like uncharacterized kinase [Actinoplanes lutulentus]|uniref:Uncharacterized protein n=1 Tax=Actinoplanes lutulentus TaxID=1287878 RepID=A0A327Z0L1_9ACTN|nr:aspartokinase-like uncharacterized kinase [Actinoplanes lutulentus]RAK26034.1 hypothetical protein B0I29_12970 [Actinoplanes lutulentus]
MARRENTHALELEDAYWQLPSAEYVPHATPPERLLEDSDHLDASWSATVASLREEAAEDKATRLRIAKEVEILKRRSIGDLPRSISPAASAHRLELIDRIMKALTASPVFSSLRRLSSHR